MKKILSMLMVLTLLVGSNMTLAHAQELTSEDERVYISEKTLTQDEMAGIFMQGYSKIVAYDNNKKSRSSGTHSVTTCTSMKKRDYDFVGYSRQCFHESFTSVGFNSGGFSMSIGVAGISISVPVSNMSGRDNMTGSVDLNSYDLNKVNTGSHFSCVRMKAYSTYATYSAKIYDNASGQLLTTSNYSYTYTFKNNKDSGVDYYLVARTPAECDQIKANGYAGTNAEKKSGASWRTVSASSSILP